MRIVVTEFITLDGVIEDPGGAEGSSFGGWAFKFDQGAEGGKFKLDETMGAEALLLGRITYEGFAAAWPTMERDEAGFADKMNSMPKYVVSSTLESPEWQNSQVVDVGALDELKARDGGDLLVAGSGQVARELLRRGLVDELRLMVFPTAVGGGKRLFDEGVTGDLELVESRPVGPDGVVVLVYRPKSE